MVADNSDLRIIRTSVSGLELRMISIIKMAGTFFFFMFFFSAAD